MSDLKKLAQRIKSKIAGLQAAKRRAKGKNPNEALQHELSELSEAYNTTNTDLLEVKAKLEAVGREMRRNDLTKDEIAALPLEVPDTMNHIFQIRFLFMLIFLICVNCLIVIDPIIPLCGQDVHAI